jgi:hypothetical protein
LAIGGERFFWVRGGRKKGTKRRGLSQKARGVCKKLKPRAWQELF